MTFGRIVCEGTMEIFNPVFSSIFRPVIADSNWTPASLFSASEVGVWFDPSDLTTLFQDTAGTLPITAVGQTVAVMLDKSLGLSLGSEIITNGNFSSGSSGWTGVDGTTPVTVTGGEAVLAAGGYAQQASLTLAAGKAYRITFSVRGSVSNILPTVFVATGAFLAGSQNIKDFSAGLYATTQTLSAIIIPTAAKTVLVLKESFGGTGIMYVDNISIKLISGNHATQVTSAQRPAYQVDGNLKPYLAFDGANSGLVTNTVIPSIDKVQAFAGIQKLSDAASGNVIEIGTTGLESNIFGILAPSSNGSNSYRFTSRGSASANAGTGVFAAAPNTSVLTGLGDITGSICTLRRNGLPVQTDTTVQGSGNYAAYPIYIGRRGGVSLPFNGKIYSLIARFGSNLTTSQITSVERWVNSKTSAY